jgi:hypothetical protein
MIEIHSDDNIYIFNEAKHQTRTYSWTKYNALVYLLSKNIEYNTALMYANYYVQIKVNECKYDKIIHDKIKSFGLE